MIGTRRVYAEATREGGPGFLVDRLWPRGLSKRKAKVDRWLKDAAPSDDLRRWFRHDPRRWKEFKRRYFAELDATRAWMPIIEAARRGDVTLLYAAKDEEHNNAVALREYLQGRL